MSSEDTKMPAGHSRLVDYKAREDQNSGAGARYQDELEGHIERNIGPVTMVYEDIENSSYPIDILVVPATSDRKFHYLVTAGMSDQAMIVPIEQVAAAMAEGETKTLDDEVLSSPALARHAELVMALPAYWPIDDEAKICSDEWAYPITHLKDIARMPHEHQTWLAEGHSIGNSQDKVPLGPKCKMTSFVLDRPVIGGEEFSSLKTHDGNQIHLYSSVPLHSAELDYKLRKGFSELKARMDKAFVTEIFDPNRRPISGFNWRQVLPARAA